MSEKTVKELVKDELTEILNKFSEDLKEDETADLGNCDMIDVGSTEGDGPGYVDSWFSALRKEIVTTLDSKGYLSTSPWIKVDPQSLPNGEVMACGYQKEIIFGYLAVDSSGEVLCESEHEVLTKVTHYQPKPVGPS